MKRLLLISMIMMLTIQCSFAECRDDYYNDQEKMIPMIGGGGLAGIFGGMAVGLALAGPVAIGVLVGAEIAVGTAVVITATKHHKMIRLIDESLIYAKNNGKSRPGKTLTRLFNKTSETNPEMSMLELATWVKEANDKGTLCRLQDDLDFFRDLKHDLRSGAIRPINLD